MGRWDRFHEARRRAVDDWLSDEIVKTLVADLRGWPPPIQYWNDLEARTKYADALSPACPRPPLPVLRDAFQLARWELERNYDALDFYARNDRASRVAADPCQRQCLDLLHAWLTDSCLEIIEVSRLGRAHLIACLTRIEAELCGPARAEGGPA